jgi:hypothetical protein
LIEQRVQSLIGSGDKLFSKRHSILSLWQELVDNFYPEREGFTVVRTIGEDFAAHLMTSYPVLIRRDLGNSFSSMLRPTGKEWFHMRAEREEVEDNQAKRWLEYATGVQRRAMYDPAAQFVRTTKEADHDFATFGQCVISAELNREGNRLLYRGWHLKDVAWCDGYDGKPDNVYRKWKPEARVLAKYFPGKLHADVTKKLEKDPYCEVECCHIVIPSDDYEAPVGKKWKTPYVSIHVDKENQHIMEEVGIFIHPYVIPRWQTISGSQYAMSPATMAALPDARTLQAMTLTLLEAGEKATNPPLVAKRNLFREDVNFFAGGLTYADIDGDGKLRDNLEILTNDKNGIPFGMDMRDDQRNALMQAFYLNKINMPPPDREMTAYEVSLRNEEFIRQTLPLFEPMEHDYNGALCERTFEILLKGNAFGPPQNIPQSLQGQNIQFRFESPLHDAIERRKAQQFGEAVQLTASAMELDPSAGANFDVITGYRDSMAGLGVPAKWIRPEEEAAEIINQQQADAEQQRMMQMAAQGSEVDKGRAEADQAMIQAEEAA